MGIVGTSLAPHFRLVYFLFLPSLVVNGLNKGEKYFFRVSAKNEAGRGEPAEIARPVLCKPKYGTFTNLGNRKPLPNPTALFNFFLFGKTFGA